ncbi:MAG: NAD(P)H-dependent oxidoreductase subunit E [Candidatus Eisenbacteria bacterium]
MKRQFSGSALGEIKEILSRYPVQESALLPVLHIAQRDFGCVDEGVVVLVADVVGVSHNRVRESASFYTMFSREPRGRHVIRICTNISCALSGSEDILAFLVKRLGIPPGGTSQNGLVTLETVECLGSCGTPPVMMVDDEYHENLNQEKVQAILRKMGV